MNKLTTILMILAICSLVFCGIMFGVYSNKVDTFNAEIGAVLVQKDSVITEQATTIQMLSDSLQSVDINEEVN